MLTLAWLTLTRSHWISSCLTLLGQLPLLEHSSESGTSKLLKLLVAPLTRKNFFNLIITFDIFCLELPLIVFSITLVLRDILPAMDLDPDSCCTLRITKLVSDKRRVTVVLNGIHPLEHHQTALGCFTLQLLWLAREKAPLEPVSQATSTFQVL